MCRTGGGVFCESFSRGFIHAADKNNKTFAYRPLTQGETDGDRDRNSLLGKSKLFLDESRRRCIFTRRNLLGAWESDPKIFTFCPRRRSV